MQLRKEIEPQWDIAEKRYPEILKLILDYTDFCDKNGDVENTEYQKLEANLHHITAKDMSQYNLWEWWEADGAEILAFNISLPDAEKIENITLEELQEIVRRIKTFEKTEDDGSFKAKFNDYLVFSNRYFEQFLALNFKTFKHTLFQNHQDKNGKRFDYLINEIVVLLWNDGKNR
jgi:hypothetical protein